MAWYDFLCCCRGTEDSVDDTLVISYPYDGHVAGGPVDEETRAFVNLSPAAFAKELADARSVGVHRALAGTAEFAALMGLGVSVKWVVTIFNELWVVPEHAGGLEIKHSVASHNERCFTGGFADWRNEGGERFINLNNWTGHYQVSKGSVAKYGRPAWQKAGVNFRVAP